VILTLWSYFILLITIVTIEQRFCGKPRKQAVSPIGHIPEDQFKALLGSTKMIQFWFVLVSSA